MGLKIWLLSNPGYDPATFWLLAQNAYQLRYPGPQLPSFSI
jgi:hypothetical protein